MNNFNVKEIGSDGINERNVESAIFFFYSPKKKPACRCPFSVVRFSTVPPFPFP